MPKLSLVKGATSQLVEVFIQDSSSTTGAGLTGLVFNTASLTAYYYRSGAASAVSITLATMTLGTWATGGFVVVDGTNMPGVYQLAIPDAALASGADKVTVFLKGAANMAVLPLEIQLTSVNVNDGVRGGMTALPNAAAGATGGLDCMVTLGGTASAGAATSITLAGGVATDNYYNHQVVQITGGTGVGQARTIVTYVGSTKVATVSRAWTTNPDNTSVFQVKGVEETASEQLAAGTLSAAASTTATLAGASSTSDIYVGALLVITAGTGQRQARVITAYNGGTLVATVDRAWATTPDNTSVYVVLGADLAKTNSSLEVVAASVTGAVGSVTGAVGSVTGNVGGNVTGSVGSVVGNVGGNVTGSVGSVVGAVGSVTGNVGGNVTGSVGSVAAGGITATSLAADAITAAKVASDVGVEFADALLDRNMATGSDSGSPTVRTVRQALRALRNKFAFVGSTRTVYAEDDATASWTSVVTTSASADPITSDDPAGP